MKITLSFLVFIALSFSLIGQMPDFHWAKSFGGAQDQNGGVIVRDSLGNYFMSGRFTGTADFDPGPGVFQMTSVGGGCDGYILKLDPQGNFIWAKQIQGDGQEECIQLQIDNNGYLYIIGSYTGSIDLDPGPLVESTFTSGFKDAYVLKLDLDGNYIWSRHIGGTAADEFYDLEFDQQNNIVIGGIYTGNIDADPGTNSVILPGTNAWMGMVLKLTENGDFVFAKAINSTGYSIICRISVNSDNELLIQGSSNTTCDLDPGVSEYNVISNGPGYSMFITKWTNSGDFIWGNSVSLSVNGFVFLPNLNVDAQDNLIIVGQYQGTNDFDPGSGVYNLSTVYNEKNGFILKLNTNGEFVWVKDLVGNATIAMPRAHFDEDGYMYISGFLQGGYDFDPGPGVASIGNSMDINPYYGYVAKYTESGEMVWVHAIKDARSGEVLVSSDKIAFGGSFVNSCDFDPTAANYTMNSLGSTDAFILEWSSNCFNYIDPEIVTSCTNYTWNKNNQVYLSSGSYSYTVENPTGCDSVFSLELTIPVNTISMDFDTVLCDTSSAFMIDAATPIGGTYQINGQTYNSLDPGTMASGSYSMIYTIVENGCSFSDTAFFSVEHCSGLSIQSNESLELQFYPNPNNGQLFYMTTVDFDLIKVFDSEGRWINVPVNEKMIDLSGLANGLYTVLVTHSDQITAFKVVLDK